MSKRWFLPTALALVVFSSCTTAYKTGQTPDDVYYSPARPQDEYVQVDENRNSRYAEYSDEYYDDRYLRMKIRNRTRWTELNDWYFNERPYRWYYGYTYYGGCICNDPWTPYTYWNSVYNPYYHPYIVTGPRHSNVAYNLPRTFNLNTYTNTPRTMFVQTGNNPKYNTYNNFPSNNNNSGNNNGRSNSGNILRNIFGGSGSSNSGSSGNHTSPSSSGG